jgi:toxin ParE1/3/4
MRSLIVLSDAKSDIYNIRLFTSKKWGQNQSKKYLQELFLKLNLINKNPNLGISKEDVSQYTTIFPHKSHIIYYYFTDQKTFIIRVLHQSMLPKNHLKDRIK